ncbi:MAG: TonB-dependent receptor, partial [Nitrosospira sp.]|nr:TonB-dependent receptor [Nitrosospira sp.]
MKLCPARLRQTLRVMSQQKIRIRNLGSIRPLKIIQSVLVVVLCASPVWAAGTSELVNKPVVKKTMDVAQAAKPVQSEQASNPKVPAPAAVITSEKGVPVEVAGEIKGKDKASTDDGQPVVFKTMVIQQKVERDTRYTSPIVRITREQIELQNAQTVEEAVKFMPSLQIRQRFPGDPNGVMAIRGSDMFATGRNMVFVDGMPIHNFLQASFNGAPRWSLVGPNEVEAMDVVYGGFSAEYSGNSIGGVINITTRMPQKREFYTESSIMIQPYNNPFGGDKQVLLGNREFASYGDRFKDRLSVLASYNRIENQSQPMTYFIDNTGLVAGTAANPVTGAYFIPDTRGTPSAIYGDSGVEKHHSSLYKIKLGLDITPTLLASFTSAYEVRTSTSSPQTYLTNGSGQPFYTNGTLNASQDGSKFDVISKSFGLSENTRETLQLGGGINGKISADSKWTLNSNVSSFNVLRDDRGNAFYGTGQTGGAAAARAINSGADGQLQAFNNYNWFNADAKLSTNELFNSKKLSLLYGYHYDQYNLGFQQSRMTNYAGGIGAIDATKTNTGQTSTHAGFGQAAYRFRPGWDVTAGVRYEDWSASNGVVGSTVVPDRNLTATSPKVSLGYESGNWKYRYSFGRAHRF